MQVSNCLTYSSNTSSFSTISLPQPEEQSLCDLFIQRVCGIL